MSLANQIGYVILVACIPSACYLSMDAILRKQYGFSVIFFMIAVFSVVALWA